MNHEAEIIVAGGGPAGSTAAAVLARCHRRVVLIDHSPAADFRIGEALPPAAFPLLRDLNLLDRMSAAGHRPCYGNVVVWGSAEPIVNDFVHHLHGSGWHLKRALFDETLRDVARSAGVQLIEQSKVTAASRAGSGWQVSIRGHDGSPRQLKCAWLIDATGRNAQIARGLGVTRSRDDLLVAFIARFHSPSGTDHDSRTVVEAAPSGWWYSALLPSAERVVAYLTDADLVNRSELLGGASFIQQVATTHYIRRLLIASRYELTGTILGADAGTSRLDCVAGAQWTAVGDAAVAFDPLSSQGIFNSLYTGLRVGQAVDAALQGDDSKVRDYIRRVNEIDAAYRRQRSTYYAMERRWPNDPFWLRRSSPPRSRMPFPAATALKTADP